MAHCRQPWSFSVQFKRNNNANNICVQQHQINMINEEWEKKHKMMPHLSPFTSCVLLRLVQPDEMADLSIAGLQWFILIPRLNLTGSHRPSDSCSKPYLHREEKKIRFGTRIINLLQSYKL